MRDSEKLSCRIVSKDFSVNENSEDQGPDPIDVAVGHRIRVRRKWLGISQSTLADHLGVSFQQVQKYERGANRVSASMLVKIAQKLDTSVGELVGETAAPLGDESLFEKLAVPGAVQLLEAFASVQQPAMRTAILNLTRSLIEESSDERTLGIRRAR
ncbi:helix-turn-helix domain-containing protein [Phenylobacterium sp.]|uniref:helix-turn-helix domain-containing protein n=1 Tax=Phenylobacterium sp. TaxID=1871053 RepID=UPI0027316B77|nr:helix-turn-helix domain-containing protein [Phenylobacterium sp.]